MQKISPFLWFDKEAREATEFYIAAFGNGSKIIRSLSLSDTPSGTAEVIYADLWGTEFGLMSAGPYFKISPAMSFIVACSSPAEVDEIWAKLSPGGTDLMPLSSDYGFSARFGWLQDKFGVSWQVMDMGGAPITQRIVPKIMYIGANAGKAEEAMNFYVSIFPNSSVDDIMRHPGGSPMREKEGTVANGNFTLEGRKFAAMDSAYDHKFALTEGVSLLVTVDTQEEIDRYSDALSTVPEAEQCGWVKDKYGLSWQINPAQIEELLHNGDKRKVAVLMKAYLQMKRFNIAELQKVYDEA